MRPFEFIESRNNPGHRHMEADLLLLSEFDGSPVLRIYNWQPPCISLGYSQNIDKEIDVKKAARLGWDVVKRPTGGGIVFHNEAEVTYSLVAGIDDPVFPKGLVPTYKKISEAIVYALRLLGIEAEIQTSPRLVFTRHPSPSLMERGMNSPKAKKGVRSLCFSYPAEYEIVVGGKKIVGSAQKRGKKAFLQQGSIFIKPTDPKVFEVLKNQAYAINAVSVSEVIGRVPGFEEVKKALIKGFQWLNHSRK